MPLHETRLRLGGNGAAQPGVRETQATEPRLPTIRRVGGSIDPELPTIRRKGGEVTPMTVQNQGGITAETIRDDPFGSIGLLLSNVGAALQGKELPSSKLRANMAAQHELALKRFTLSLNALKQATEFGENLSADKRESLITNYGALIERSGGNRKEFEDVLRDALDQPDTADLLKRAGGLANSLLKFYGNDFKAMKEALGNPTKVEMLQKATDFENTPEIYIRFERIKEMIASRGPATQEALGNALQKDTEGKVVLTEANLQRFNATAPPDMRLDQSMLETMGRNPEILASQGFVLSETALAAQGARAKEAVKAEFRKTPEELAKDEAAKTEAREKVKQGFAPTFAEKILLAGSLEKARQLARLEFRKTPKELGAEETAKTRARKNVEKEFALTLGQKVLEAKSLEEAKQAARKAFRKTPTELAAEEKAKTRARREVEKEFKPNLAERVLEAKTLQEAKTRARKGVEQEFAPTLFEKVLAAGSLEEAKQLVRLQFRKTPDELAVETAAKTRARKQVEREFKEPEKLDIRLIEEGGERFLLGSDPRTGAERFKVAAGEKMSALNQLLEDAGYSDEQKIEIRKRILEKRATIVGMTPEDIEVRRRAGKKGEFEAEEAEPIPTALVNLLDPLGQDPKLTTMTRGEARKQRVTIPQDVQIKDLQDAKASAMTATESAWELHEQAGREGAKILSGPGFVGRTFIGMRDAMIGFYELQGVTVSASIDPADYTSALSKAGIESAVMKSRVVDMAFALARRREGGRLTDQDVARAIETIGANTGSPAAFTKVLGDVVKRIDREYQIVVQATTNRRPTSIQEEREFRILAKGLDASTDAEIKSLSQDARSRLRLIEEIREEQSR